MFLSIDLFVSFFAYYSNFYGLKRHILVSTLDRSKKNSKAKRQQKWQALRRRKLKRNPSRQVNGSSQQLPEKYDLGKFVI